MSAILLVTKDKKQLAKATISGDAFIIGRDIGPESDCDLKLDETLASRQHAKIVFERGQYTIRDLQSRNGTFVNREKLENPRRLKDGDEIDIGALRLKFVWDKNAADDDADEDETRGPSDEPVKKTPGQIVKKKAGGNVQVALRVLDGPLKDIVYRDWQSPLTLGKDLENNVVFPDGTVSRAHAKIVEEEEVYFMVDLDSDNGTYVDGKRIPRKARLANGQKIRIGLSNLVFEMVDLQKRRKSRNIIILSVLGIVIVALLIKVLQPPDFAGQHVTAARNFAQQGDLAQAKEEYEAALTIDPNRAEAKRGMADTQKRIDGRNNLDLAAEAAGAEDYDKARDLCYRVLRDFPQSSRALELQDVIKSIEDAKTAFAANNWGAAVDLLDKALQKYPQSKLIQSRLEQAKSEQAAQQNLAQATDALDHQQLDLAQTALQSIPTSSFYYPSANQQLAQIALDRRVADDLAQAQTAYQAAHIQNALATISAGLQMAPDNQALLDLQNRARRMVSLIKPLEKAEALSQPSDVDALLRDQKACQDVISFEPDPANVLGKRALAAQIQVSDKLIQAAQSAAVAGDQALQTGDRKKAYSSYDLAVRANPASHDYVAERDKLRLEIVGDCHKLYDDGRVHQSLGQSDLARQSYQQILSIGIPGEEYYEKTVVRLKELSP